MKHFLILTTLILLIVPVTMAGLTDYQIKMLNREYSTFYKTFGTDLDNAIDGNVSALTVDDTEGDVSILNGYIQVDEISAPTGNPASNKGWIYSKDSTGTTKLYFEDSAGTVTDLLAAGSTAWDDIGDPDANGSITMAGYTNIYTSTLNSAGANWTYTNTTADLTADVSFIDLKYTDDGDANGYFMRFYDNSGGDLKYSVGADGALVCGDLTGATITGTTGTFTTLYQPALVSAAAGNVALTIDAAGNGTITIGGTSTGATIFPGNVDIGNAATDTLTITGIIDSGVTLDDGVTNSPALTLKDATDETVTFVKSDGDDVLVTLSATEDFEIVTGNLAVGNGSPGTAAMDGEDFYVQGDSEFDGSVQLDGAVTIANDLASSDQFAFTFADNAEEGLITSTATDYGADAAIVTMTNGAGAGQTNNTYVLRVRTTANGDAQDHFLVAEDNAGDDKFALNSGGDATLTLDAGANLVIDGSTTTSTVATGIIDVDMASATTGAEAINAKVVSTVGNGETTSAIAVDLDDDTAAAGYIYGLYLDSSDAVGSSTLYGVNITNNIETHIQSALAAAGTWASIDAATVDSTASAGVMDVAYDTITNGSYFLNLDMGIPDPAGTVSVGGILIDLDDDTNTQAANASGVAVTSTDLTGNASTVVRAFYTSGCDAALQADNGYVRVGTGSTPDVTPGDDDLFVEGTSEVDGAARFDGAVTANSTLTGDGGDALKGFLRSVTNDTDDENLTVAGSQGVYTNAGDGDAETYLLPDAAAGLEFTFIVMAAQQLRIDTQAADKIIYATTALDTGEYIWADAVGESMTLIAVDGTNWIVTQSVGTWTQETP